MKSHHLILAAWAAITPALAATPVADVAGGNHQTIVLSPDNVVLSFGQDLHIATDGGKNFIGGKLGRPIDHYVLPGKNPDSLPNQANYNPIPAKVVGLDGLKIASIAIGQNDAAAITEQGDLYLWGPNNHGQLGLGDTKERREAVKVPFPDGAKIKNVDIGGAHTLAFTTEGQVYSCGINSNGQLGLGDKQPRLTPTLIESLKGKRIVQVAAGQNTHSLFLVDDGSLYVTGSNASGQLGLGDSSARIVVTPKKVPAEELFKFVTVGVKTSFAIDQQGRLWGTGDGSKAHFGFTDTAGKPDLKDLKAFTRLPHAPEKLVQVAAGSRHVAVLDADGKIYTWGIHTTLSGQLGIGPPEVNKSDYVIHGGGIIYSKPQLIQLPGNRKAIKVNSIANNVFVVTEDGKIYGWGQTAHGRLGYGIKAVHSIVNEKGKKLYGAYSPVEIPVTDDASKIKLEP